MKFVKCGAVARMMSGLNSRIARIPVRTAGMVHHTRPSGTRRLRLAKRSNAPSTRPTIARHAARDAAACSGCVLLPPEAADEGTDGPISEPAHATTLALGRGNVARYTT